MKKWGVSVCVLVISGILAVVLSSCSHGQVAYQENLDLHTGDTYKAHYVILTDMDTKIDGQWSKMTITIHTDMSMKVDKDRNATIYCRYDSVKSSVSADGQFKPDPNPIEAALNGKGFFFKVNQRGEVLEINGVNKMLDRAVETLSTTGDDKKMLKSVLQQMSFCEPGIKTMLSGLNGHLPHKAVQVGDSWEDTTTTVNIFCPVRIKNKWKVTDDDDGVLFVEGKGTPVQAVAGDVRKVDITGSCEETVKLHKNNAFLQNKTTT